MKSFYLQSIRKLLLYSGILGLIILQLVIIIPAQYITPTLPFQFVFFVALTTLICNILLKAHHERFSKFLNTYLMITTVKLLFFLAVIVVYLFLHRSDAAPFAISFFILYLCFTAFEVSILVLYSKKQSNK